MTRDREAFVPKGASRFWPFVVDMNHSGAPPAWKAQLFLGRSILAALLHIQPTETRENWRDLPHHVLAALMHDGVAGPQHPSRKFVASLIRTGDEVLDVGCGAGVGYEVLVDAGLPSRYVGIDSSEPSIDIARRLYPNGDFRIGNGTALVSAFGSESFDVVVVRHVLEHLPDFEAVMNESICVSRRLAVFIFFLTPRANPLGVRKIDLCTNSPFFYNHVYSRRAINRFLARLKLHWRWCDNLGLSRAGWFTGETNSALIVSREESQLPEAGPSI